MRASCSDCVRSRSGTETIVTARKGICNLVYYLKSSEIGATSFESVRRVFAMY